MVLRLSKCEKLLIRLGNRSSNSRNLSDLVDLSAVGRCATSINSLYRVVACIQTGPEGALKGVEPFRMPQFYSF